MKRSGIDELSYGLDMPVREQVPSVVQPKSNPAMLTPAYWTFVARVVGAARADERRGNTGRRQDFILKRLWKVASETRRWIPNQLRDPELIYGCCCCY